jgi:hypothetical protein
MASRSEVAGALAALVRVLIYATDIVAVRTGQVFQHALAISTSADKGDIHPIPWTPFEKAAHVPPTEAQIASVAQASGHSIDEVRVQMSIVMSDALYVNSRYQVAVHDHGELVHLSIKRIDQAAVHDWRELQRIKDELIGRECEGVELYPANRRLVDTSTQYHLWCSRDPSFRFPFGFGDRLVTYESGSHAQRKQDF